MARTLGRTPLVVAATAIALLAFAAVSAGAAAPDFSWSTSASSNQAAARTALTMSFSSSSPESLTRLDVDLPAGMMNNPASATACPSATFLTDKCAAASAVGTVASQVVLAGRATISVPGSIYRVSDPSSDAAAVYGIVLRPPLSNIGVTAKRYLTDSISFQPNGALRHSINASSIGGIAGGVIAARLAQLNLQFLATQPSSGAALLTNTTTCATRQFTATGYFTSGPAKSKTSSSTTTGCAAVPFDASIGLKFAKNEPNQRTSFAILLGQAGSGASQLHTAHINSASVDLSQIGSLDLAAFDALPGCTDGQAASAAGCPANSRIGDITANVEGFGPVSGGALYRSYTGGRFALGEKTGFKASHITFGGGSTSVSRPGAVDITGLPELPYVSLQFTINKDLLVLNGTCGPTSAVATITPVSPVGTHHEVTHTVQQGPRDCAPVVKTITPEDADTDGDGYADQPFRAPTFEVPFSASDESPLDASNVACTLTDPKDATAVRGKVKVVKDMGTTSFRCQVSDAVGGNSLLTIQVTDSTGHVTIVKRNYTVIATPPAIAIDEQGVHYSASPSVSVPFTITDDSLLNPSGSVDVSCVRKGWDGTIKGNAKLTKADAGRATGVCTFDNVGDGDYSVELTARNYVGWVTIVKGRWIVDTTPPAIAIDESGVHFTADSFFDVFTELSVTEANPGTSECSTGDINGDGVADFSPCGPGQPVALKKGLNAVNVKLADRAGNTSSVIVEVYLDTEAPTITLTNPADADANRDGVADQPYRPATFDVGLQLADVGSGLDETKSTCSLTDPQDAARSKGTVKFFNDAKGFGRCSVTNAESGDALLTVTAVDYVGTVTIVKITFTIDTTPPVITDLRINKGAWLACRSVTDPNAQDTMSVGFSIDDSSSGVSTAAVSFNRGPRQTVSLDGTRTAQTAEVAIDCRETTTGLDVEYRVFGTDNVGNVSEAAAFVTIDASPPTIVNTEPIDDDITGDGVADQPIRGDSFDVPVFAADDGSGVDFSSAACKVKPAGSCTVNATKGINSPNLLLRMSGLPAGNVEVQLSVADNSGLVTTFRRGFIIDAAPPGV